MWLTLDSLLNRYDISWATAITALSYCLYCDQSGVVLNTVMYRERLLIFQDILLISCWNSMLVDIFFKNAHLCYVTVNVQVWHGCWVEDVVQIMGHQISVTSDSTCSQTSQHGCCCVMWLDNISKWWLSDCWSSLTCFIVG